RKDLFVEAGRLIVDLARRHYEQDDDSVLPRAIATRSAFENAVALDVAMGGSTNTVLHLLAAAREAEVPFTVADIDEISRRVPCLSKVAPNTPKYHMEDVHRAGGIPALMGELNRAPEGCVVKTAGVPAENLTFRGPARVFESQDSTVEAILRGDIVPGDVVVIRYEGPKGGPGMQEMLYPTSFLKGRGLGRACALITDGRFSGGTSGLSICHIAPEAAAAGAIALARDGDRIEIDIPRRELTLD